MCGFLWIKPLPLRPASVSCDPPPTLCLLFCGPQKGSSVPPSQQRGKNVLKKFLLSCDSDAAHVSNRFSLPFRTYSSFEFQKVVKPVMRNGHTSSPDLMLMLLWIQQPLPNPVFSCSNDTQP